MKIRRFCGALGASLLTATGCLVVAVPADAAQNVSGYVTCLDQSPVEGVWIAAGSNSGYASWNTSGTSYNAHFSRANIGGSWTVHVGCGGSPSRWTYDVWGNITTGNSYQSWSCYPPDMGYPYSFCQRG